MEHNKRLSFIILVGVLLVGNVFFGLGYVMQGNELQDIKNGLGKVVINGKVLNFTSLFIKEVLQAESEVDFETRLQLENAVRELKDEEIMAEWQSFVESQTEAQAQNSVKRLLGVLVGKVRE